MILFFRTLIQHCRKIACMFRLIMVLQKLPYPPSPSPPPPPDKKQQFSNRLPSPFEPQNRHSYRHSYKPWRTIEMRYYHHQTSQTLLERHLWPGSDCPSLTNGSKWGDDQKQRTGGESINETRNCNTVLWNTSWNICWFELLVVPCILMFRVVPLVRVSCRVATYCVWKFIIDDQISYFSLQ